MLYDFAWDEFCSFYVEMVKTRLADPASRPVAQRVLAHMLDTIAAAAASDDAVHHRRNLATTGRSGPQSVASTRRSRRPKA